MQNAAPLKEPHFCLSGLCLFQAAAPDQQCRRPGGSAERKACKQQVRRIVVARLRGQDGIAASGGGKHQKPVAAGLAGIAFQYHVIPGKEHHALSSLEARSFALWP